MDIRNEAFRLATVATIFVWVGWFTVIYAIIAGSLLVDRPRPEGVNQLVRGAGRVARRDRRADLPGPDRRRHGPLPAPVRDVGRRR